MKKIKKPLLFALALLPIAAVGGWFVGIYQFEMYDEAIIAEALSQVGSMERLLLITSIQSAMYAFFCGFVGYVLAEKTGLMKSLRLDWKIVKKTVIVSIIWGILFSLDYWTFGSWIPGIQEATRAGVTVNGVIASVLYGGVIEEIMLRMFMMSFLAWIIWKLFYRKTENVPEIAIVVANVMAALLFAAGHLPATYILFGTLSPLILLRCFLMNGGFALLFGRLYRKYGIQYAILSHALLHIVSKSIWAVSCLLQT